MKPGIEEIRARVRNHKWLPLQNEWTCDRDIEVLLENVDELTAERDGFRTEIDRLRTIIALKKIVETPPDPPTITLTATDAEHLKPDACNCDWSLVLQRLQRIAKG